MKDIESAGIITDKIFKFLLKCQRNRNKPDLHSFNVTIIDGTAYVECREYDVYMEIYRDGRDTEKWIGSAAAAANKLDKLGAVYESIDM